MLVSDKWQKQGLGTELLRRLLQVAQTEKLTRVTAEIMADNHGMKPWSTNLASMCGGFPDRCRCGGGIPAEALTRTLGLRAERDKTARNWGVCAVSIFLGVRPSSGAATSRSVLTENANAISRATIAMAGTATLRRLQPP